MEIDGMSVTSVERTVIDMATMLPLLGSVMIVDRALLVDRFGRVKPLTDRLQLLRTWERLLPFRGHIRARDVVEFGETRAESALESVSRVSMRQIGVPRPVLQFPHSDAQGAIGESDFFWNEFNLAGEADGTSKYLDTRLRNGRSAEQVVLDEKLREDRIRAIPRGVVRWDWAIAMNPVALRGRLVHAGLPTGIRWH